MYQAIWGGRRKGQHRSYCFIHLSNSVTGDGTTETILIHHICWNPPRRNSLPPIIFPREMLAARIASSKNDRQKTIYCPDSTASLSENTNKNSFLPHSSQAPLSGFISQKSISHHLSTHSRERAEGTPSEVREKQPKLPRSTLHFVCESERI